MTMLAARDDSDVPMTRSAEKRAQIVDAAAQLFTASGYGSVSMDAIAAKAQVSKRTVYSHFTDKSDLFIAIMDRQCERIGERMILVEDPDGNVILDPEARTNLPNETPRAVLRYFLMRFLKIFFHQDAVRIYRIVQAEAERFPELALSFSRNGPEPLFRRLSKYLMQVSQEAGKPIDDPMLAAFRLVSMVKEPFHLRLCLGTAPPPDEETMGRHINDTVDFLLSAYGL